MPTGHPTPAEPCAAVPDETVRRRHVLYVCGYDPQGPDHYRALFAREVGRFDRLWNVATEIAPGWSQPPLAPGAVWRATARTTDATVDVAYEFLRWDDLIEADFRTPLIAKLWPGFVAFADGITSGTFFRVARAAPWFAGVWLYPFTGVLVSALVGLAAGVGVGAVIGGGPGVAAGAAAAALIGLAALDGLRRARSFVVHLLDDWIAQRRYVRRTDPAIDARVSAFAARLGAVVKDGEADEILVVGHSSGSFLAIDMVARALDADPALARRGPAISLLTVGNTELLIALHPAAGWFRAKIARLAAERALFWAEVVGGWDVLNFPDRDPLAELRLPREAGASNPVFRRVFLTTLLMAPTIAKFQRRLKIFRVHFQYVMANERRGPYDYFSLVCGDKTARAQFSRPEGEPMAPFATDDHPARFAPSMTAV